MIYRPLGRTGLLVSRLCMGVLTIGPLQNNLPLQAGAEVLVYALRAGINFFDTAKIYQTYPYIKKAMEISGIRPVICSKSYDYTYAGMKQSLEEALDEMGISYIDIFMLHEQESMLTLKGHWPALEYLLEAKEKGLVKSIGISTHSVQGVLAGAQTPEIEVIHPLINIRGLGILDGSREQMLAAIRYAHLKGKGIYAMKVIGGGNLNREAYTAFSYIARIKEIDSLAIGMKSRAEIDLNIAWMQGRREPELEFQVKNQAKRLLIESWCEACGQCIEHCRYGALQINSAGVLEVKKDDCLLCGYCASYCPNFCIKVV
ncbi:MAG: aldo/keto reductase [Syntrophomonadaceae bacterium]|nr:aldo/keto reductase [Syntrophomonadaceae bacterium]